MQGLIEWFYADGIKVLIGSVLTGVLLLIFNPIRDFVFRQIAKIYRWFKAVFRALPSYLKLRRFIFAERPLWSFRKGSHINRPNAPPTITVMNFKGGVGKTTIAANLAAAFSEGPWDLKVLLVDLDYQGSLSDLLRTRQAGDVNLLSEILQKDVSKKVPQEITTTARGLPNVDLITAEYDLTETEDNQLLRWLMHDSDDDVRSRLARLFNSRHHKLADKYDLIIMDAPPRLSLASVNALKASDYVLIPTKLQSLSVAPIHKMLDHLKTLQTRIKSKFEILGVICSMTAEERRPTGTETIAYEEIKQALEVGAPRAKIYSRHVKDLKDIGRPAGVDIGYLVKGASGDRVRELFNDIAAEIAEDIGLNYGLANAAE